MSDSTMDDFLKDVAENRPRKVFEFTSSRDLVAAMNRETALVPYDNEMRYVFWDKDKVPVFRRKRDAEIALAPFKFQRVDKEGEPEGKPVPGIKIWTESAQRNEYSRIVFNPKIDAVPKDELNLFGGWGIEPAPGNWRLMKKHLVFNVCRGNRRHYKYLLMWMSQMVSQPEFKSGVCVVLRGPEGVGKSKLGQWLKVIVGKRHSTTTSNPEHAVGKFNTLIRYKILVVIEESPITGDKRNTFADLITNIDGAIEGKGVDAQDGQNYSRFILFVNGEWAVPVLAGDRRYFILDVGDKQKENKEYFAAIDEQMENGGAAAMLHDLLAMNVKMRDMPKPPMTDAKQQQIEHSIKPEVEWLADVLSHGRFPLLDDVILWQEGGEVLKDDVAASYRLFVPQKGRPATASKVGKFLAKYHLGIETLRSSKGNRPYLYVLPSLADARTAFLRTYPGFVFENDPEEVKPTDAETEPTGGPDQAVTAPSSVVSLDERKAARGRR